MINAESVLFTAIKAVTDGLGYPVKWPNTNGPENEPTWIDVVHIPNGVAKSGLNDLKANHGLLNIGVMVQPNSGAQIANTTRAALAAIFLQGTVLRDTGIMVEIYSPPVLGTALESGQKTNFPLSIRYRSFES